MNWFTEGILIELIGGLLCTALIFVLGRRYERQKKIRQFYDGIMPTLKTISAECKRAGVPKESIQRIARTISDSFSKSFIGEGATPVVEKLIVRPPGSIIQCGVCDDTVPIAQDQCPRCGLDCCSWDFSVV